MKDNRLARFSLGIGDRFAHQTKAQLSAIMEADKSGIEITPVWNKSFREHKTIGSKPESTRKAADEAVKSLRWKKSYFVDADHVGFETVDLFTGCCDFFTIDVADFIGRPAAGKDVEKFVSDNSDLKGDLYLAGLPEPVHITTTLIRDVGRKYLYAVQEAARIYRKIADAKKGEDYVIEVSMDETDQPQGPAEILFILSALAAEKVPVQTIAPKFSGRFNKGVDYQGNLDRFAKEFTGDVEVLIWASENLDLPQGIKLSVHSGSDKFSLYPVIRSVLKKTGAGLHLKTAGTTWLEELIGLAESNGKGLNIAKEIYKQAFEKRTVLCQPYASVINIQEASLPPVREVMDWSSTDFVAALRHEPENQAFNPDLRQLLHVGYKIAAEMGDRFLKALDDDEEVIARNVSDNLLKRHIERLFPV
jgi:hypothetical protein